MGRLLQQRELQTGLAPHRFTVSVSDFRWADHASPAGRSPHTSCRAEEHTEVPWPLEISTKMSPEAEQARRAPANDRATHAAPDSAELEQPLM
jgi:hypothetical protein